MNVHMSAQKASHAKMHKDCQAYRHSPNQSVAHAVNHPCEKVVFTKSVFMEVWSGGLVHA